MKTEEKRVSYLIIGCIILILNGLVYAWTVLQAPIAVYFPKWTAGELSMTFTIMMGCFSLGCMFGGYIQKKKQLKILFLISGGLIFTGFTITAMADSLLALYLGIGVIAGFAAGVVYNIVIGTITLWFPDKQAFVSGIMLMSFGISSFLLGKVYTAFTPSDGSDAWRNSFLVIGVIVFMVLVWAAFIMKRPTPGYMASKGYQAGNTAISYEDLTAVQMIKRLSFWCSFIWGTFLMMAGLAVISQGSAIAKVVKPDMHMNTVATIAGLLFIFNGIGRVAGGRLFERAGYKLTMIISNIIFICGAVLMILALKLHILPPLVISFTLVGFAYGNVASELSAFAYLFFGAQNYPLNYSVYVLNALIASFGSAIAGALFDFVGSFIPVAFLAIGLAAVGMFFAVLIRTPKTTADKESKKG